MKYEANMATMSMEELIKNFKENVIFVKDDESRNKLGVIKWNEEVAYLEKAVSSNETAGLLLGDWLEGTKNWSPSDLNKEGFLKDLIEAFFNEQSKTFITEEAWSEFPKVIEEAFEKIEVVS